MSDKVIYTVYDTRNISDNFVKEGERRLGISPEKRETRDYTCAYRENEICGQGPYDRPRDYSKDM